MDQTVKLARTRATGQSESVYRLKQLARGLGFCAAIGLGAWGGIKIQHKTPGISGDIFAASVGSVGAVLLVKSVNAARERHTAGFYWLLRNSPFGEQKR